MSDLFSVTFDLDPNGPPDVVVREGKVFEAGEYPDKELTVTPDDLAAAVTAFEPVPVDLEHVPTLLDGKLGRLEAVRVAEDGKTLVGRVSLPRWLSDALGNEPVRVSTTWNRANKKLMGLALVRHPRVSDAALMSAYMAAGSPPTNEERDMNESRFKRFLRWLSGDGEEAAFALEGDAVETTAPTDPPSDPAPAPVPPPPPGVDSEVESLRAALAAERASRIQSEAVAFADAEIAAHRAYPAEREVIIAAYVQAAQEDITAPWPAAFAVSGQTSRVALLTAQYGARPAHDLTTEAVGGASVIPTSSNGDKPDTAAMSEDRKQVLLNMTHLGRAVAQKE